MKVRLGEIAQAKLEIAAAIFGKSPYFFGKYDAPVMKVGGYDSLPSVIDYGLNNRPNSQNILAWLYAFYVTTKSRRGSFENDNWTDYELDIDDYDYREKVGLFLAKYIADQFRLTADEIS